MKNILFVIGTLVSVAAGASTGGWGSLASPIAPQLDINLGSGFIATTAGQFGVASANQQIFEHASGDAHVPAYIQSSSATSAEVEQVGEIEEIILTNPEEETVITLNNVETNQVVSAAADDLEAYLIGANEASVEHSGETYGLGGGVIIQVAETTVDLAGGDDE